MGIAVTWALATWSKVRVPVAAEDGLCTRMSPKVPSPPKVLSHLLLSSKAPSPLVKLLGNVENEREKDQLSGPQSV